MKKSTKFFVFGGLICILAGTVIMLITGAAGGVNMFRDMAWEYKGRRTAIIDGMTDDWDDADFSYFAGTREFSVSDNHISSIHIAVEGGELNILEGKSDRIKIYAENGFGTQYAINNGTLIIKEENDWFGFANDHDIVVYLPSNMTFESINLAVGGGEVEASDIEAQKVVMNIGAGEAYVQNLIAHELTANVGAGEITIDHGNIEGDVEVNVGMGELEFEGFAGGNLDLKCGMGDIQFLTKGMRYEDFNYEIKCAAGNIDLNGSSYSGMALKRTIDNGSSRNVEIDCGMGDVTLEFYRQ